MNKRYTLILGTLVALLCLSEISHAQESQIKIKITKEIDGERRTLEKEYTSEEEMRNDPEFREFTGNDEHDFYFHFSDEEGASSFIEIEEINDGTGKNFFFFSDEEDNDHQIRFLDGDHEEFEVEIEKLQKEIRKHLKGDHTEDEIEEMTMHLRMLEESEGDKYIYVIRSEKVKIVEVEDEEFGKLGKVEESKKLLLEDLTFSPNPSDGRFKLQFTAPREDELAIKVYDLKGKEVYTNYFERFGGEFRETIDLTNREEGIYLLEIAQGKKRLTRKIVVE